MARKEQMNERTPPKSGSEQNESLLSEQEIYAEFKNRIKALLLTEVPWVMPEMLSDESSTSLGDLTEGIANFSFYYDLSNNQTLAVIINGDDLGNFHNLRVAVAPTEEYEDMTVIQDWEKAIQQAGFVNDQPTSTHLPTFNSYSKTLDVTRLKIPSLDVLLKFVQMVDPKILALISLLSDSDEDEY